MKNLIYNLLLFVGVVSFASCSKDSAAPVPGVPNWTASYPKTPFGATSLDFVLQADKKSTAYWVVTDAPITITPEDLKTQSVTPTSAAIKFKGTSILEAGVEKTETVTGLTEKTKYYSYIVAESVADSKLQATISSSTFTTSGRQVQGEYNSTAESRKVQFLIYRPEAVLKYPDKKYPTLFFLGGNGEIAAVGQINMIRNGSLPEFLNNPANNIDMMVMSIQHTVADWNAQLIDEGISYALTTFPSDEKKLYLTGISGGGYGAWRYAIAFPNRLAAMIPISGGGNTGQACTIKSIPVWAFTNNTDPIVNVSQTAGMVNAYNACSPAPPTLAKYDKFTSDGHDCWRRVYDKNHGDWSLGGIAGAAASFRPDIYTWLLSKSK